MSLATTCPQCGTSFKVVPDQLKLRRGQVRCGVCRHVFSGLDTLRYVQTEGLGDPAEPIAIRSGGSASIDAEAQPQADPFIDIEAIAPGNASDSGDREVEPTLEPEAQTNTASRTDAPGSTGEERTAHAPDTGPLARPATEPSAGPETEPIIHRDTEPFSERAAEAFAERDTESLAERDTASFAERDTITLAEQDTKPLLERDTGMALSPDDLQPAASSTAAAGITPPASESGDAFDALARDLATPRSRPEPEQARADDETDAVDFFSTKDRTRGFSTRATLLWALISILLAALLAAQAAIGTRDWLASRYPAMRAAIAAAIAPLGLEIAAPRALDALTIEGFELQSTSVAGLYAMNALLRNGSAHEVRWPAMELTLTDQAGAVVVRKVLLPADYLPGASLRSTADPARVRTDNAGVNPDPASSAGIKPAAEIALRTALSASDVAPTGYTVKLFYP